MKLRRPQLFPEYQLRETETPEIRGVDRVAFSVCYRGKRWHTRWQLAMLKDSRFTTAHAFASQATFWFLSAASLPLIIRPLSIMRFLGFRLHRPLYFQAEHDDKSSEACAFRTTQRTNTPNVVLPMQIPYLLLSGTKPYNHRMKRERGVHARFRQIREDSWKSGIRLLGKFNSCKARPQSSASVRMPADALQAARDPYYASDKRSQRPHQKR